MRHQYIARLTSHLDDADFVPVDHRAHFNELPHTIDAFVKRAQSLDPNMRSNQCLARIGRADTDCSVIINEILDEAMRSSDEHSATTTWLQFREARE